MAPALIDPKGPKGVVLPPTGVLVLGEMMWSSIYKPLQQHKPLRRKYMGVEIYTVGASFSVAGPVWSAPVAVVALENLIAMGVKFVVAFGCAGSLQPDLHMGDLLLVTQAKSEEGTTPHYLAGVSMVPAPALGLQTMRRALERSGLTWREGTIWTTDAFYRETIAKIKEYQAQAIMAVEMETSALFAVAHFRGIELASLQVISDELASLSWKCGFQSGPFQDKTNAVGAWLTTAWQLLNTA